MVWFRVCALVIGMTWAVRADGAAAVRLRETAQADTATHVVIEMTAQGLYRPNAEPGASEPDPLKLKVETRFDFHERPVAVEPDGGPARRVVRRVNQAASAINGQIRPFASSIRPEVAILVALRRDDGVFTFSPGGPLTRSELELVQGPGDPLDLAGLLPEKPVAEGDTWAIGPEAAKALSAYDALATNSLKAKLESLDETTATIHLAGDVRGAVLGGEGTMTLDGTLRFDREAGRIERLTLTRNEQRQPGPVEAGLDLKSTLTVTRTAAEIPAELSDEVLKALPTELQPGLDLLRYSLPEGNFHLLHDRDWHLFWDSTRLAVLKWLDHGEVVAQCNMVIGPEAGKGRHQDPEQFREDVRGSGQAIRQVPERWRGGYARRGLSLQGGRPGTGRGTRHPLVLLSCGQPGRAPVARDLHHGGVPGAAVRQPGCPLDRLAPVGRRARGGPVPLIVTATGPVHRGKDRLSEETHSCYST